MLIKTLQCLLSTTPLAGVYRPGFTVNISMESGFGVRGLGVWGLRLTVMVVEFRVQGLRVKG
jgi:hypothetical protein